LPPQWFYQAKGKKSLETCKTNGNVALVGHPFVDFYKHKQPRFAYHALISFHQDEKEKESKLRTIKLRSALL
jgi:hypothetical protein